MEEPKFNDGIRKGLARAYQIIQDSKYLPEAKDRIHKEIKRLDAGLLGE